MLAMGVLAFGLPVIVAAYAFVAGNCETFQHSISAYYYTVSRNIFVGSVCAIAFCLFAYKGYCRLDARLATLAAVFALGVALSPTSVDIVTACIKVKIPQSISGIIHFGSAAGLFILLGCFSAYIFTKSKGEKTDRKKLRNKIYKVCGYLIFIFIFSIALYLTVIIKKYPQTAQLRPVYWLELLSLWAFGFSWLTKSEIIFGDIDKPKPAEESSYDC